MKRELLLKKIMKCSFMMCCFFLATFHVSAQDVTFTSVNPITNVLTISNPGSSTIDLTNYQLCLGPGTYVQIGSLTPVNGSLMLAAGADVTLSYTMNDTMDGLSLFSNTNFGSSNAADLIAYVQWGATGQPRVAQAVTAGRAGIVA